MGRGGGVCAILLLLLLLVGPVVIAEPVEDKQALLDFLRGIPHVRRLNWSPNTSACGEWVGVACTADGSRVRELRLPGLGLAGPIPPNTLGRLTALRTLSLRFNSLSGPFPKQLLGLTSLGDLHLQSNAFSGPLPTDFSGWAATLTALDLSSNAFNGSIPSSLGNLTALVSLDLSRNELSGAVPGLNLPSLTSLNLSGNHLRGVLPPSLRRFPRDSFRGNPDLVLLPPPAPAPAAATSPAPAGGRRRRLGQSVVLGMIVGGCAVVFVAAALLLVACCPRGGKEDGLESGGKGAAAGKGAVAGEMRQEEESNRVVFFSGCNMAFDLEDLLRASAEVLGKGSMGTSYKAVLDDATTVVVKRLKDVGVGRKEFEQQVEAVGGMSHPNLVPLRAYYYSKDEKLMVTDHYPLGSLSAMLHGRRGEDRVPLDWESRVSIALGAAKGVAFIHAASGGKLVHGNIKSTNVLVDARLSGCVSDYCLTTLINPMVPPVSRAAGYRAPEVYDTRKATQMSDVYSFGVLLLELLTAKSPIQVIGGGDEIIHLVRWVQSVVREEWTAEVFDVELMRVGGSIEEELVDMLQIAMACVSRAADQRPKMEEVVRRIQDLKKTDSGARPSSEARSEGSSFAITPPPLGSHASISH